MTRNPLDLGGLTVESFSTLVGKSFCAALEEGAEPAGELKLKEALPGKVKDQRPFSLYFEGSADLGIGQGLWYLSNSESGTLGIFLVPVSGDSERVLYQAVFN